MEVVEELLELEEFFILYTHDRTNSELGGGKRKDGKSFF